MAIFKSLAIDNFTYLVLDEERKRGGGELERRRWGAIKQTV
jgi:hypothetical protein